MAYQKQVWREYDDTKTELQNALNGALATPERLNHIENGIANSADKAEVTAQLQHKANKVDVRENTNTRPINVSEMDTETKQLFTGGAVAVVGEYAVGTENLKDKAVSVNHLNFVVPTDNKFDGVYLKNVALAASPRPGSLVTSSGGRTAIIPISSNQRYYVEKFDASNRFRLYLSSSDTEPVVGDIMTKMVNGLDTNTVVEVIPDEDSKFLVITTSTLSESPRLNVTESNIAGKFIPYRVVEKRYIENQRVDVGGLADNVTQAITTKKYFVNNWGMHTVNINTGFDVFDKKRVKTEFIKVKKGTRITFPRNLGMDGVIVCKYSLVDKTYQGYNSYNFDHVIDTDCYIKLISRYTDLRDITDPSAFNNKCLIDVSDVTRPYLVGNFNKFYNSDPCENVSLTLGTSTINDVYTEFDELLNTNSDIMSKNLLGYGSDPLGVADNSLPIYEYVINNPKTKSVGLALNESPTILIQSGTHGNEKSAVWSTLQFFKQLLNNYHNNDSLASIKSNVTFKVIPILNPGGYNDSTRLNRHGVDINRNFSFRWTETTSGVKGTSPYSETESKILRDWLLANNNVVAYIDYHNTGQGTGGETTSYFNTPNVKLQKIYSSLIRRLTDIWHRKYNQPRTLSQGWITNDMIPCTFNEAIYIAGIEHSAILEISFDFRGAMNTEEVIETGVDLLANYLLAILHLYNNGF